MIVSTSPTCCCETTAPFYWELPPDRRPGADEVDEHETMVAGDILYGRAIARERTTEQDSGLYPLGFSSEDLVPDLQSGLSLVDFAVPVRALLHAAMYDGVDIGELLEEALEVLHSVRSQAIDAAEHREWIGRAS